MKMDEIVKLTREAICDLLQRRQEGAEAFDGSERRTAPRWPFPGTVELRPDGGDGTVQWFGVCRDVSEGGLGMTCDQAFEPGTRLEIAFHLPEASFYGLASVRHCTEIPDGCIVGLQFEFED